MNKTNSKNTAKKINSYDHIQEIADILAIGFLRYKMRHQQYRKNHGYSIDLSREISLHCDDNRISEGRL